MNKIVEKYFDRHTFNTQFESIQKTVCEETGFKPETIVFKGMIYDEDKLGSVIYKGKFNRIDAILKLQGLRPETDEIDIISNFNKQNKSSRIRLPKLYKYQHWNPKNGYGYLISEYISSPRIFEMPYASQDEMQRFCEFYQEYKTKCINRAFIKPEEREKDTTSFVTQRVNTWKKISDAKGLLEKRTDMKRVLQIIEDFNQISTHQLKDVKMVFSHGHLTANDILDEGGKFVLFSNLYWSYRPEFYDLVFGLHWCLENIRDTDIGLDGYKDMINGWLEQFYEIPFVKEDTFAKQKIFLMLLERTMGGILIDTGSRSSEDKYAEPLLKVQLDFSEHLMSRIMEKNYSPL